MRGRGWGGRGGGGGGRGWSRGTARGGVPVVDVSLATSEPERGFEPLTLAPQPEPELEPELDNTRLDPQALAFLARALSEQDGRVPAAACTARAVSTVAQSHELRTNYKGQSRGRAHESNEGIEI